MSAAAIRCAQWTIVVDGTRRCARSRWRFAPHHGGNRRCGASVVPSARLRRAEGRPYSPLLLLEGLLRVQDSLHLGSALVQGLLVDRAHELLHERRQRWIDAAEVVDALLTPHLHPGLDAMPDNCASLLSVLLECGRNGDAADHGH